MGHGQRNSVGPASFVSSIKSSARRIASNVSPIPQIDGASEPAYTEHHVTGTRQSSTSSRSSHLEPYKARATSGSTTSLASLSHLPDRKPAPPSRFIKHRPSQSSSGPFQRSLAAQESLDALRPPLPSNSSYADADTSTGSLAMAGPVYSNGLRPDHSKPPSTAQSNMSFGQNGGNGLAPALPPASGGGMQNPNIVYQQIHDVSSKRISTLDYLRKAPEGGVYWFNTLRFNKSDLAKMPFFEPKKLARRATNYLLLGLSLPSILDVNSTNPQEYMRALNALLVEFESYQQIHPPEGGQSSSISRARIPSMFKRTKGRRTSSAAADIGLPMNTSDPADLKAMTSVATTGSSAVSFPASEQDLLPGEDYTHLLTPSLPFDPDFFETFATLCDVLIDCYTKIMGLISSPAVCIPGIGETFSKVDGKLRKIIIAGMIKEFEDASRAGAKAEFAGLGKVVLGGLM